MDGQCLNTGPGITYVNTGKIFETEWLNEVMAQKGNYVIKADTRDAFRSNIGEMVSFVRVINDINTQKRSVSWQSISQAASLNRHMKGFPAKPVILLFMTHPAD